MTKPKEKCSFCRKVTYSSIAVCILAISASLSVLKMWILVFISAWFGVLAALYAFDKVDHDDFRKLQLKIKRFKLLRFK